MATLRASDVLSPQDFMASNNARVVPFAEDPVLTPRKADEAAFQKWYKNWATAAKMDQNPDDPRHHYDYRAAYNAGVNAPAPGDHWPSTYKDDSHPRRFIQGVDTRTGEGHMSLPMANDPQPTVDAISNWLGNYHQDSLAGAIPGLNLFGGTVANLVGMDPKAQEPSVSSEPNLKASQVFGLPAYLQEGYTGPHTGSRVGDALVGLGDVLNFSNTAGPLGAATPMLAAREGASMGSFGSAKTPGVDLKLLDRAQMLNNKGADMEDILKQTGWFEDIDGIWKTETPQNRAYVTNRAQDLFEKSQEEANKRGEIFKLKDKGKLSDFYHNPDNPYPDIPNIDYSLTAQTYPNHSHSVQGGVYSPPWPQVGKGPEISTTASDPFNMKGNLSHEIEHVYQELNDYPNKGSSPMHMQSLTTSVVPANLRSMINDISKSLGNPESFKQFPLLKDSVTKDKTLSDLLVRPRINEQEMAALQEWLANLASKDVSTANMYAPIVQPAMRVYNSTKHLAHPDMAQELYAADHGEEMARAAALRRDWTPQQLLETIPDITVQQDLQKSKLGGSFVKQFNPFLPVEQQIIKYNN
jgi:hypothetical protein